MGVEAKARAASKVGAGPAGVAAHAHCEICSTVVAVGTRWCSPECEAQHDENQKEKKRSMWKFIGLVVALMVLFTMARYGVLPF